MGSIKKECSEPSHFTVGECLGLVKCDKCEGTGTMYVQNGPDDVDPEWCDKCAGEGYVDCFGVPENVPDDNIKALLRESYLGTDL